MMSRKLCGLSSLWSGACDDAQWYENYKGADRLPLLLRDFLNQYTEQEFKDDFETLYPGMIYAAQPVSIMHAAAAMMRVADHA